MHKILLVTQKLFFRCDNIKAYHDYSSTQGQSEDESLTDGNDGTLSEEDDEGGQEEDDRNHSFKRTHFHSATLCDFCKKKVIYWYLVKKIIV